MTVHLIKLCVGIDTVRQLEDYRDRRRAEMRRQGLKPHDVHLTRNTPRRAEEILDGGSLYWVIRRQIRVRQRIIGIERAGADLGGRHEARRVDRAEYLSPTVVGSACRTYVHDDKLRASSPNSR